jgi:chromosome transmission fidelity protein 1
LICSALQWLQDEHALRLSGQPKADSEGLKGDEEPDWMRDFEVNKEEQRQKDKEEKKQLRKLMQKSSTNARKSTTARDFFGQSHEQERGYDHKQRNAKPKKPVTTAASTNEDDDFLVEDYCSDDNVSR